MRSDIAQGDGMYKSTDGGRTWTPHRPRRLAADRARAGRSRESGRRLRGGPRPPLRPERRARRLPLPRRRQELAEGPRPRTTTPAPSTSPSSPGNPDVIYAALWQTRRTPWNIYPPSNGPGSGLYKSTDGGDHWTPLTGHGFPAKPGRIGLAVAPTPAAARLRDGGRAARAGSTARTTAARPGRGRAATRASGGAAGTSAASRWSRRTPTSSTPATPPSTARRTAARPSCRSRARPGGDDYHELWIDPRAPGAAHPRRRPGRGGVGQRRRDLELLVQPADRPVLPRDHRQPLSLLGLRLAAGLRRRRRAQPHQHLRRHQPHRTSARPPPAARATTSRPIPRTRT